MSSLAEPLPAVEMELSDLPPLPPPSSYMPSPSPSAPPVPPPRRRFCFFSSKYERLIRKATPRSRQAPPSRPVNSLTELLAHLPSSSNHQEEVAAITSHFQSRLSHRAWTVQLKSQILIHHILRRAPQPIVEQLAEELHETFKQRALTPSTTPVHSFITSYDAYLKRRTALLAKFQFPPASPDEKNPTLALYFVRTSAHTMFQVLPFLMRVIDSLITVQMALISDCPIAIPAFTMLKRDLAVFSIVLSRAITRVVQLFNMVDKREKAITWRLIMNYTALVGRVKRFSANVAEVPTHCPGSWPELSSVSSDVLRTMRKVVDWK